MKLLDGKKLSSEILKEVALEAAEIDNPTLACIIVGDNPASHTYVAMKRRRCQEVGITSSVINLPEGTPFATLKSEIEKLNQDPKTHAILVQQPLPYPEIYSLIDPKKDVDGFHPLNMGKLLLGETDGLIPCTPLGILCLMQSYGIDTTGKHALIIGRSNIVGKPLASLLMQKGPMGNATVTLAHSQTKHLSTLTQTADIVITAMGAPRFLTGDMIKDGAIVIDVGITRAERRLIGDVDFDSVSKKASFLTPVPGGVGPMTIAMLLKNTLKCAIS